jgi:hypothetical protein
MTTGPLDTSRPLQAISLVVRPEKIGPPQVKSRSIRCGCCCNARRSFASLPHQNLLLDVGKLQDILIQSLAILGNQKMRKAVDLQDRAWQVAADTYRVNLFMQLTGRATPKGPSVSDAELTEAIGQSFTQVSDARYREMIELSTDAALEAYNRVVAAAARLSRSRRTN